MNNEKLVYIPPMAEIEMIGQEDVLVISVLDEEFNLDENGSFRWKEW